MRLGTIGLTMALFASISVQAFALPPDAQKWADDMFQEGRDAMEKGDFAKALKVLRTSQELDPKRGKVLNIAVCEEHLGMVASALAHIQEVDTQIPAGDPRRPTVDGYLAKLPARIPHLRIDLASGAPADVTVTIDSEPLAKAKLGTDLPLDPGKYVVHVTAPGRAERRYEVTLEEGKRSNLAVEPGVAQISPSATALVSRTTNVAPFASAPTAVPSAGVRRSVAPGLVLGGIGALGLGAGVVFVIMRAGRHDDAVRLKEKIEANHGYCTPSAGNFDFGRCPALVSATSMGDAFGTASVVSFIVGGLAAAGAVTYAVWPTGKPDALSRVSFGLVPVVGGREQGLAVSGVF